MQTPRTIPGTYDASHTRVIDEPKNLQLAFLGAIADAPAAPPLQPWTPPSPPATLRTLATPWAPLKSGDGVLVHSMSRNSTCKRQLW